MNEWLKRSWEEQDRVASRSVQDQTYDQFRRHTKWQNMWNSVSVAKAVGPVTFRLKQAINA